MVPLAVTAVAPSAVTLAVSVSFVPAAALALTVLLATISWELPDGRSAIVQLVPLALTQVPNAGAPAAVVSPRLMEIVTPLASAWAAPTVIV